MIIPRPAMVTNAKTVFIQADCFIPIKLTKDNPPRSKIAETMMGKSKKGEKKKKITWEFSEEQAKDHFKKVTEIRGQCANHNLTGTIFS